MEQFFLEIDYYLIYGYSLSLIAGILVFKHLNSYTITALLMVLFEFLLSKINGPLYGFILTLNIHSGRITWYLSWILFNLLAVYSLDYLHAKFSISKSSISKLIRICLLSFVLTYFFDFMDRYLALHDSFYYFILIIRSSIQIGIVFTLFYGLFKTEDLYQEIPHAAHNRSVTWFQSLNSLPPLQRAKELQEWEEFTNDLPTDKSLIISSRSDNYRF
jgi:hypothetical protein